MAIWVTISVNICIECSCSHSGHLLCYRGHHHGQNDTGTGTQSDIFYLYTNSYIGRVADHPSAPYITLSPESQYDNNIFPSNIFSQTFAFAISTRSHSFGDVATQNVWGYLAGYSRSKLVLSRKI